MMPSAPGTQGLVTIAQRQAAIAAQQARFLAAKKKPNAGQMKRVVHYATTSTTTTTYSGGWISNGTITSSGTATTAAGSALSNYHDEPYVSIELPQEITVPEGRARTIWLPDGTEIDVQKGGSFEIKDQNAKVIYRANRIRDFNPFLNASDKLEDFIRYCGDQGVRQGEVLQLPISLFIGWLVLEAAKADREPEPDIKLIPDLRKQSAPRCGACGRFIRLAWKRAKIEFCGTPCFERRLLGVGV
jgi:hypothetical protein